ncbi:hypothetical protein HZS_7203 [Henneguya salminicola]|nr:hypothetical protein HZS_7203 [Henneguya salminicola]
MPNYISPLLFNVIMLNANLCFLCSKPNFHSWKKIWGHKKLCMKSFSIFFLKIYFLLMRIFDWLIVGWRL